MGKIIKAEDLPPLTEEQIEAEIERAKGMTLTYDEDCPPLSEEQLARASKWEKEKREGTIIQKYGKVVYWAIEEDVFKVEVPELTGCIVEGKTIEEAMNNADAAVKAWLDNAKETKRPIHPPIGRRFLRYLNQVEKKK